MTELRWQVADAERPQGALFDEPVFEREPGRGEFRGLEFLHVQARSIINEVKGAEGYLPFRFTINAYRGCSHACSYCVARDTPVLLADGRLRRIAEVRVGDAVVGTERVGRYRRFVATPVLDHWSTVRSAYSVVLDDGTELVSSGDHRFLSDRGWKHVTGAQQGALRRPHLTTGNALLGVGGFPDPPKHDDEYRRGYLCGMVRGDGHLGHYTYERRGRPADVHRFRLALTDPEPLERAQRFLADAGVATTAYTFTEGTDRRRPLQAIRAQSFTAVATIEDLIAWPLTPSESWTKGFLAGVLDAEGHLGGVIRISNGDPVMLSWIQESLDRLGFRTVVEPARPNGVRNIRFHGGLPEILRFTLGTDPATTRKRSILGRAMKGNGGRRIVAIEPLGVDIPMYDITTGTGDFIADGVISHNCFARPSHTYLDLDAGDDFDRKIVVKVNAVSLLRRELDPRRWRGDHVAMGTNTDPYQRAEGKYRLTRGILEVLTEASNPFSILTKSTLVLRDLDLLAEAAQRTDVRVNLSIGTLDEHVWHTTEPGTPHPRQRLRAVRALNDAGVSCGVLVAPVLPGLSDRPEQLEEVATAATEAGAVSVSTVLLHLRPGVREVYLDRLGRSDPALAATTARRYAGRTRLPKAEQQRVSDTVHAAVRRAGGLAAEPREARHLAGPGVERNAPAPTSEPGPGPEPEQLPLL